MIFLTPALKMDMKFMEVQLESNSFGNESDEENLEDLRMLTRN